MKKFFSLLVITIVINGFLMADEFDFKDPKGVNSVSFKLDAPLEPINGLASGLSGKLSFDGKDGKSLKGELLLAVDSFRLPNDKMTEFAKGEMWLDAVKFPSIKISVKEVLDSKSTVENEFDLKVNSIVEIKGVAKEMVIDLKVTYLKDKLGDRVQKQKGDLLVVRSSFSVTRSDFKLKAGEMLSVVANDIVITANVIGACSK